jgi:hypothetical protein
MVRMNNAVKGFKPDFIPKGGSKNGNRAHDRHRRG